jgi:PAS domain S-box-containing protein
MTTRNPAGQDMTKEAGAPSSTVRLVGIGASAGGLEALRELMETLPESNILSYVIAQHMSPTHVSMLLNLLAPLTHLQVENLEDPHEPKPGRVYITPPNSDVILKNGLLRLSEPLHAVGPKPSVNHFFHSLADELGDHAIGIILSGTGSDGASGIRAIKAAGGLGIVQAPETAKYDGMPKAAIHTGGVDLILSPAKIGPALDRLLSLPRELAQIIDLDHDADEYGKIVHFVRTNTAFKLSDYKMTTVRRRIARRMGLVGVTTLQDYVAYLQANKEESTLLMRDTFISVTAFFRDTQAFQILERVIEDIVKGRGDHEVIRCWVPACASGEEVYSIAMLFEEALRDQKRSRLQYMIFASDLDDDALERARAALYPTSELDAVPKALRDRYMESVGDHCRLIKSVRNRIVFARQNVIEDPPFARLNLVSCRNFLIYLNPPAQKRVLEVLHYSLGAGGLLFLGKSESVEQSNPLFAPMDKRARLYRRVDGHSHYTFPMTQGLPRSQGERDRDVRSKTISADMISVRTLEELAERYAPPSLVINAEDLIIHFQGDLNPFLRFPKGRAEMYLFDMLAADMRAELRALIYRCRRQAVTTQGSALPRKIGDKAHLVTPTVSPLEAGQSALLLVSFLATPEEEGKAVPRMEGHERDDLIIKELEQELANSRTHLNIVVEELETSNEELQSLNEELQSTNEELQSTNEELQTTNEELQSTNEELLTVNEELQVKTAELEALAGDLTNVKESLALPLMVVDNLLRITQANNACGAITYRDGPLEQTSLNSVHWRIEAPGICQKVKEVIQAGADYSGAVGASGEEYSLHIMPYRLHDGEIAGAVMLFENIAEKKRAERRLRLSEERFRSLVAATNEIVWTTNAAGEVSSDLPDWRAFTGQSEESVKGQGWIEALHPDDRENAAAAWARAIETSSPYEIEYRVRQSDGAYRDFVARGVPVLEADGRVREWVGTCKDISERKQSERDLREREHFLRTITDNFPGMVGYWTKDLRCAFANPKYYEWFGRSAEQMIGTRFQDFMGEKDFWLSEPYIRATLAGESQQFERTVAKPDGSGGSLWVHYIPDLSKGECSGFFVVAYDTSQLKRTERELRAALEETSRLNRLMQGRETQVVALKQEINRLSVEGGKEIAFPAVERDEPTAPPPPAMIAADFGAAIDVSLWQRILNAFCDAIGVAAAISDAKGKIVVDARWRNICKDFHRGCRLSQHRCDDGGAFLTGSLGANKDVTLQTCRNGMTDAEAPIIINGHRFGAVLIGQFLTSAPDRELSREVAKKFGYDADVYLKTLDKAPVLSPYEIEAAVEFMRGLAEMLALLAVDTRRRSEVERMLRAQQTTLLSLAEDAERARMHADGANRAKSDFLANMSHEIRTPMNAVLGLAHLIAQTELTEAQRDYVTKIRASGRSLLSILDDILDFSKIEADRMEVEHIDFRLATVFDDLATILSVDAAARDIETAIAIDPALPRWIKGDPSRLQQVLVNLTGNAIKFTESGTVSVRADLVSGERAAIRFTVTDTGIGMTEEEVKRLFHPFTQADSSTTRRFGGTGLGLVICKRLVELMGGEIGVSSAPGHGSAFWFAIPFAPGDASLGDAETSLRDLSVLIVDDNEIAREALMATIKALGWKGEAVASGKAALKRLRKRPSCDLLLIDWQMPQLDGLETSRRIRAETRADNAPIVIMVTGFKHELFLRELDVTTVDAVLTKPVTASSLYDAVGRIDGKRSGVSPLNGHARGRRAAGVRILVVEDNAINQDVVQKILENEGAAVEIAGNGAEALEWLRQHAASIDAVLMDAQMPVMDGFEATRRVREDLNLTELPIIALSAGVRATERERCLESGMNDFISKPLDVDRLIATILRHTSSRDEPTPALNGPVQTTPAETSLAAIPGLDLRQALERLGGEEAMLRRLLRRLSEDNEAIVEDLRRLINKGQTREAAARSHTLIGGAGNLGLTSLARQWSAAETAIMGGDIERLPALLEELDRHWLAFRSAVSQLPPVVEAKNGPSEAVAREQLDLLKSLLREGNLEAVALYERIAPAIRGLLGEDDARTFTLAIERFEFSSALQALTGKLS